MSLYIAPYDKPSHGKTKALLMHVRVPGQRWWHAVCFGNKRHYRRDGSCVHTEALTARLTPYGKAVTKIQPWGGGGGKP